MAWTGAKGTSKAARLTSLALVEGRFPGWTCWAGLTAVGWEWAQKPAVVAADTTAMAHHTHLSTLVIRLREFLGSDPEGGVSGDEA